MKKFSAMSISGLMLLSVLAGCSSETPVMNAQDATQVQAQSAKKNYFINGQKTRIQRS